MNDCILTGNELCMSVSGVACVSMVSAEDMLYNLQADRFYFFQHIFGSSGLKILTGMLVCWGV